MTVLLLSLILSPLAHATWSNVSVGGVSSTFNLDTTTDTTAKPTIYGGYAASTTSTCAKDGSATCNSCDGKNGLAPCNLNSVYPSLKAHFTMTSSATTATGVTVKSDSTTLSTTGVTVSNGVIQFDILWSELCGRIGSSSTCTSSFSGPLTVTATTTSGGTTTDGDAYTFQVVFSYIDADTTTYTTSADCPLGVLSVANASYGYCHTEFIRGDEKVYATEQYAPETYPTTPNANVSYSGLVYFYEKQQDGETDSQTLARVTNGSADPVVIQVTTTGTTTTTKTNPTISDNRVTGLTNDTRYCFVLANQDQAGNIYYFSPTPTDTTKVCATPAKVIGLLDDKHCFIATAAFGSEMAPEVETFRHFRNQYLLKNSWGRAFVRTYYKYSPPLAQFISESEILRTGARLALWPLLVFAQMSLELGLGMSLLLLALATVAVLTTWRGFTKRRRA